jgi:hypothetical protein
MAETAHKEKEKKPRAKFYIPRESIFAQLAIIFMLLSAIFRLIGVWGRWGDVFFRNTQIILPLCCNILYILCLFFLGKKGFFLSSIPVVFGVAFFIIKSFGFDSWIHTVLCILLYLLILFLYCATVFGFIRTKWLLPPLFGLPFIYHIFVEDLPMLNDTVNPMTFTYGMQELSVLCIMLGLFCVGLGLKKQKPLEESELPKIKDPVVVSKDSQPQQSGEEV